MNLDYPALLDTIKTELASGRTESHAFLLWFLKNYYRLDEMDATDAVCDGPDDKGIDGIYVDQNLETVHVFQCKLVQNPAKSLGDTQLKEFVGSLAQLEDPKRLTEIASTTSNNELANILKSENVATRISDGYTISGVFVTNIMRDRNATEYLEAQERLTLYDKKALGTLYVPAGPTEPIGKPIAFDVFGYECIQCNVGEARAVFAPLKATDLVNLDGIASNELFAWNVRGSLGRTKVNKDIANSIQNKDEHKEFLLFHNGLTLLCKNMRYESDKIYVSGYSVVNGCQSLTSLYENRSKVTDDLRLMARIIELPPGNALADKITHHSNNQNPINARDLQANSTIQRRLQNEFRQHYKDEVFYRIKRGEEDQAALNVDNDEVGRLLLAFDLKEPWTCHQSYKVLDELHGKIFCRREVDAHRIIAVYEISEAVASVLGEIENGLLASYRLTQYFMLYLVRLALELDDTGKECCAEPWKFLKAANGRARLRAATAPVGADLVIDLNAEVRERAEAGSPFDFKRELKSPNAVRDLGRSIISNYQKSVRRKRAISFGEEWTAGGGGRERA